MKESSFVDSWVIPAIVPWFYGFLASYFNLLLVTTIVLRICAKDWRLSPVGETPYGVIKFDLDSIDGISANGMNG